MCENGIRQVYESSNEDIEYVRDVAEAGDYFSNIERRKAEALARQAKYHNLGKYAESLELATKRRIEEALKGIKGKDVNVTNIDENTFFYANVKSWKHIQGSIVELRTDKGIIVVDVDRNMATNGLQSVTLGSEVDKLLNVTKIDEMVTVFGNDLINRAIEIKEKEDMTEGYEEAHANHLLDIVEHYADVIIAMGNTGIQGKEVTVEFLTDVVQGPNANARGEADVNANKMRLVQGHTRYNTNLEIFTHELQHLMVEPFLNPNSETYNRELDLAVTKLRKAMAMNVKPEDLIADIKNPSEEDTRRAEKMYNYIFHGEEAANSEFLAYATTNKNVVNALKKHGVYNPMVEVNKAPRGVLQKLWAIVGKILNIVHKAIKIGHSDTEKPGMHGHTAAMNIMNKLVELNKTQREEANAGVFEGVNNAIEKYDDKFSKYTREVEEHTDEYKDKLNSTLRMKSKFDKMIDKVWEIKVLANARSVMVQNNIFSSLYNLKNNKDVAKFYELFRRTKKVVDKTMVDVKNYTRQMLDKELGFDKLDSGTRKAMTAVLLNTDVKALGNVEDIARYLDNEQELRDLIAELKRGLKKETVVHATALASMLKTNKMPLHNGYFNAETIAQYVENNATPEKVVEIDVLVSAIALLNSSEQDKALVRKAMKTHKKEIGYALEILKTREQKLLDSGYRDATWAYAKGSKQESYTGNIHYYIVSAEEAKKLKRAKIYTIEKHEDLSRIMGEEMMLVAGTQFEVPYTEGAISMVQLKNEGDSLRRVLEGSGRYSEAEVESILDRESKMRGRSTYGSLVPERNHKGIVFDYRVRVPNEIKTDYLQLDNDFVETLAVTIGNISHKDEAIVNNRGIVNYLMEFHDKYKDDKGFKFVEIRPEGKYKEYWDRLPYYLKKMVERTKGEQVLYVEESMLVNTFGYKDVSIANSEWMEKHKTLQSWTRKGEVAIQELVARWKKLVVPALMTTVEGNLRSNMIVSLQYMHDKNPIEFGKKWIGMWNEMERYHDVTKELTEAKLKADAGDEKAEAMIKALEKELESNPMHPIMEDGQYTSILEDINLGTGQEGLLEEQVRKMFDKIKKTDRRDALKRVVDELYLTDRSTMYQKFLKLTMYADAINRALIHQDNMKYKRMSKEESLHMTDGLFVNYSYLDNRWIKYGNDMDPLSFTKFFFRSIQPMARMVRNKPFTVGVTEGSKQLFGMEKTLETPFNQYMNLYDTLTNKLFSPLIDGLISFIEMLLTPAITRPFTI